MTPLPTSLPTKDLLGIAELPTSSILSILDRARAFKASSTSSPGRAPDLAKNRPFAEPADGEVISRQERNASPERMNIRDGRSVSSNDESARQTWLCEGSTVALLFIEPSTRTRVSFEQAALRLGARVIYLDPEASSLKKGESLLDMARTIDAIGADVIVFRHSASGAAQFLASRVQASVINAGDGAHAHPTQALLDAMTLLEAWNPPSPSLQGRHILIVGDVRFSRVARSSLSIFTKLGAQVTLVGPPTLVPYGFEALGANVWHHLDDKLLAQADAIYTLRIQKERAAAHYFPSVEEYHALFGITPQRLKTCKPNALILHAGPMNRGIELTSEVADGPQSVILNQAANGVFVRMAALEAVMRFK